MNVRYLIEKIENFQLSEEVFYLLGERFALTQVEITVITVAFVMGFLWCFFGLHGIRIWSAILGLSVGCLVFSGVVSLFLQDALIVLIVAIVLGVVQAVINARFYLFGAFFYTFVVTAGLALFWLNPQNTMLLVACVIIALLPAVLVLKQPNIIVILVSAVAGGVVFIAYLQQFVYLSDLMGVVLTVLSILLGALIQFILLSGREKRKQLARAAEIRLQQAIASEVEKARNFLDELDDRTKERRAPKSVKVEKTEARVVQEPTEQTEQEIVQRLKDELIQKLSEEPEETSAENTEEKSRLEPEMEIEREPAEEPKLAFEQELEKELAVESELKLELEKELESKFESAPEQKVEEKAEKIEIIKGIPEDDFAGILDLGRIQRPVDEHGFSEIDEVGEIEL